MVRIRSISLALMVRNAIFGNELQCCKILVNGDTNADLLLRTVAFACGGTEEYAHRTVHAAHFEADVRANDDYDPAAAEGSDGFLFFPFYLDVLPIPGVAAANYLASVAQFVCRLVDSGLEVVAACDFEDDINRCLAAHAASRGV